MTVELCILFPVIIVVALIAVNAMCFLGECACLDRTARNAVVAMTSSPSLDKSPDTLAARVEMMVEEEWEGEDVACEYWEESGVGRFKVTGWFEPTLFGRGLQPSIFGVSLPRMQHSTVLAIDMYSPRKHVTVSE